IRSPSPRFTSVPVNLRPQRPNNSPSRTTKQSLQAVPIQIVTFEFPVLADPGLTHKLSAASQRPSLRRECGTKIIIPSSASLARRDLYPPVQQRRKLLNVAKAPLLCPLPCIAPPLSPYL